MAPQKRSLTATLLVCYNIFLLIFAVILMAASSYVNSQFKDSSWASIISQQASTAGIVAGILTGLLSLLGLYAASTKQRKLLCVYLVGLIIIVALQFSAAVGLVVYSNQFQIRDDSVPSGQLTNSVDIYVNNLVFSLFTVCCTGCPGNSCNNTDLPPAVINTTNPFCTNTTCIYVQPCTEASQSKCFKYQTGTPPFVPPYGVSPGLCPLLYNVKGPRSARLVGPATTNACGGGDPTRFLQDLDSWTSAVAFNSAVVFFVISSIEIVMFLAGIYLLCFASRETVHQLTGFNVDEVDEDWKV